MSDSTTSEGVRCIIDRNILNPSTLSDLEDIGLSFFASACGKNRGAFVVNPADGHTYGCLEFPKNIASLSGARDMSSHVTIKEANDIKHLYDAGNLTSSDTLSVLNFLVESVYESSPNKASSPYACEIGGLAKLDCPDVTRNSPRSDGMPIRSVSLAGLLVPALWATDGTALTLRQARRWYTADDFIEMKDAGLNTVQISVPTAAFIGYNYTAAGNDTAANEYGVQVRTAIRGFMDDIKSAGLELIVNLVSSDDISPDSEFDAVVAAGKFCNYNSDVVLGMTLPVGATVSVANLINAIRDRASSLPLFVPLNEGDLSKMNFYFDHLVFGSLEMSHTATIADIASSSSQEDRSKLFYHEATACIMRSPLEFAACFQKMPMFLSTGFDLSIDDCINKGFPDTDFQDYGQCDRFDETVESAWWHRHRQSFAARQVFANERGLGWSFATWKLYNNKNLGVLDSHAKLLSLRDVIEAGLFPDLTKDIPAKYACLNPPKNDFAMGDRTYAPTPGPPPDCGNGWWNYETKKCDYWIPPPPTEAPTPSPTKGCPACEICEKPSPSNTTTTIPSFSNASGTTFGVNLVSFSAFGHAYAGGAIGVMAGIILGSLITWCVVRRNRRSNYSEIP